MEVTMLWWDNFDDYWHALRHRLMDTIWFSMHEARILALLAAAICLI
ncbi:MAG: hypothetical protein AAF290_12120 [Pseudomonadota bacterium]